MNRLFIYCRLLQVPAWMLLAAIMGCAIDKGHGDTRYQAERPVGAAAAVQVGVAETVLSAKDRPYSWPDGTMGIVQAGEKYRFFAASAGYPIAAMGTLQNPIADGFRELKIETGKKSFDYMAGGPVYKDAKTGLLLMFYHAEVYTFPPGYLPFYSEIGLARSIDDGQTWTDMGIILAPHLSERAPFFRIQGNSWDVGWGAYAIVGEYFYLYFADLLDAGGQHARVNHAVARARISDVVNAAAQHGAISPWSKYYEGTWSEPGVGGKSSPLIEQTGEYFLLGDVSYNTYLKKYIAIVIGKPWPNTDLYWMESEDGLSWTNYQKIVDDPGHKFYVTLVGEEEQLRQSGKEFFLYYVHSHEFATTGDRNQDGTVVRRRITVQ